MKFRNKKTGEIKEWGPILINSALLSAQQRKRYYWTNWHIEQPQDKGILLKDILESDCGFPAAMRTREDELGKFKRLETKDDDKANSLTSVQTDSMVAEPICVNIPEPVVVRKYPVDVEKLKTLLRSHKNQTNKEIADALNVSTTKVEHWFRTDDCFAIPDPDIWFALKDLLHIETDEFDASITEFETKDAIYEKAQRKYYIDGKMSTLTTSTNDEIIAPERIGQIGKGGQGGRIYSVRGKSVCLNANGGGGGAKTGLYKVDLPDGDYIIRKLTPVECARLQTMPDHWCDGISATQQYKCLGNGWTCDVIAWIFSQLPKE